MGSVQMGCVLQNQPLMVGKSGSSAIEHTKVQPSFYYFYGYY